MPKLYFTAGKRHVCGRYHPHVTFQPHSVDASDPRPHAEVTQAIGDELQATEPGRYEWAEPQTPAAPKGGRPRKAPVAEEAS